MADRSLVLIAFYAALIAALGLVPPVQIAFLGGVPITAQSLGVMLAGVMLGPVRGTLAVLLFLLIVALGAPFLSGGRGGLGVFAGPTIGFLIGWPIGAFVTGYIMQATRSWPVLPRSGICGCRWRYRYRLFVRRTGDHPCGWSAAGQGSSGKHDLHSRRPGEGGNRSLCC